MEKDTPRIARKEKLRTRWTPRTAMVASSCSFDFSSGVGVWLMVGGGEGGKKGCGGRPDGAQERTSRL